MTLPTEQTFPSVEKDIETGEYSLNLNRSLSDMYSNIVSAVNGEFRASNLSESSVWEPTLAGTTSGGANSTTYTTRGGTVFSQGQLTYVWFDVAWSATAETGNLSILLPYTSFGPSDTPFIGACFASNIAYNANTPQISISAIAGTNRGEIIQSGPSQPSANIAMPSSGQVTGCVAYWRSENE